MPKGRALGDELTRKIIYICEITAPSGDPTSYAARFLVLVNEACTQSGHPGMSMLGLRNLLFGFARFFRVIGDARPGVTEWAHILDRDYERLKKDRVRRAHRGTR